ncbi:MAG: hypothetical protein IPM50_09150 [Acidobacteriota bacterium]|nr:MAG: hypothetical protein IPM50_09150 [Acidobacteriota bacterium]
MKTAIVQAIEQSGHLYGQVSDPDDLMKAQAFLHSRISQAVQDFVNRDRTAEVTGFAYSLGGGNSMQVSISRPGRVWTQDGRSFDLLQDTTITVPAADGEKPRLDLIVAHLDDEIDAELDLIPFVRLRTSEEFGDGVPPYPPENISVATERHCRAVVQLKSGSPGDIPPVPEFASNEVPLYLIAVAPDAAGIRSDDILDLREVILTLRQLNTMVGETRVDLANLLNRVRRLEDLSGQPIDLSQIFGSLKTLGQILAALQAQLNAARDIPEIRFDRPKLALTDIETSKIRANGDVDSGVPCVDIEIGGRINFGDSEHVILPQNFADQSLNPRFETTGGTPGHVRRTVPITLDTVIQTDGSGFIDFLERAAEFETPRSRPATTGRNDQFIEVFGGLAVDNTSSLGDWLTYDVLNDTLTPRTPSVTLPAVNRPALFPYGDGTHVLLIAASDNVINPQVFKLNAATGDVTEITTTKPSGRVFIGDLIAPGKVFLTVLKPDETNEVETEFWEFDTATDTFTQLGVTGNLPTPRIDHADGCYYGTNKFVLVTFETNAASGKTFVFDRGSLQWTRLHIPQPFGGDPSSQMALTHFRLANVNGRPLLVGGKHNYVGSESTKVWELIRPTSNVKSHAWQSYVATFPPIIHHGLASTLDNGRPTGKASLLAGAGLFSNARPKVFASVQGGLIAVSHGGEMGVSIAEGSTFAQFELPAYTASWVVASYWASLQGAGIDKGSVKVEVSFDDGNNWATLDLAKLFTVSQSSDPGERRLRITLFAAAINDVERPVLTHLIEVLDEDGGELEDRLIIRYDAPAAESALYVLRNGSIVLSETIEPSTPEKALIHKVTPDGTSAPAVKNYVNRRRAHYKFTGTIDTGNTDTRKFDNDLAVPVRYVDARADRSGFLVYHAPPAIGFDEVVDVDPDEKLLNDDYWIVEIEG